MGCRPCRRPGCSGQHCRPDGDQGTRGAARPDVGSSIAPCRWEGGRRGDCLMCCSLLSSTPGLHLLKARSTPLGHDNQQHLQTRSSVPPGQPASPYTEKHSRRESSEQSQRRVSELGDRSSIPGMFLPPPVLLPREPPHWREMPAVPMIFL